MDSGVPQSWARVPAPMLTGCVALGKSLPLSELYSLFISKMETVLLIIIHHLIIIIDKPRPQERPLKPSTPFCLPPTFIPC